MITLLLKSVTEDTLDVFDPITDKRVGQICSSVDGWAAYRGTWDGRIQERRIATRPTIHSALQAIGDHLGSVHA